MWARRFDNSRFDNIRKKGNKRAEDKALIFLNTFRRRPSSSNTISDMESYALSPTSTTQFQVCNIILQLQREIGRRPFQK